MEGETELEMVQRHVREGGGQVQRQSELLARLQERGAPTDMAVILLEQFEDTQRLHKAHLTRLESEAASDPISGQPHAPVQDAISRREA